MEEIELENVSVNVNDENIQQEIATPSEEIVIENVLVEIPVENTDMNTDIKKELTLINLIENKLNTNITILLSPEEISIIKKLIANSPVVFANIEKDVSALISDNKINSSDIPNLICLVKDFYLLIESGNISLITGEELINICANIIKFIILVVFNKYEIDNEISIKNINSIIDTCSSLLLFIPKIKKNKCRLFCI
jgi:hypothetical protein